MNLSRSAYLFDDESQILWVYIIPTEHNLQLIIQFHTKYLKIEIFPTFVIIYRTPSRARKCIKEILFECTQTLPVSCGYTKVVS